MKITDDHAETLLTRTEYANSGNVNLDHGIKCSLAVMDGNEVGTNNPPSGAYPEKRACSKLYLLLPVSRVDLYFMAEREKMDLIAVATKAAVGKSRVLCWVLGVGCWCSLLIYLVSLA